MKKLLIETGCLIAFLVIVVAALEYSFRNHHNAVDRIMSDFAVKKSTAQILLVGNSHSYPLYESLRETHDTNIACITIGGIDLFWMQALVKRQLKEMPIVKYLVLNCDDELLGFNQTMSGLQYMNRMLYRYTDTMPHESTVEVLLSKSNFFRSNRDIGYLFRKPATEVMMVNAAPQINFSDEDCRLRALEISQKRFNKNLFSENLEHLKSIIDECDRRNVKLLIVKMPKSDCLKRTVNTENLSSSHALQDSLMQSRQVTILDFTNDTSFTRSDFANPDHLKVEAAERLLIKIRIHR